MGDAPEPPAPAEPEPDPNLESCLGVFIWVFCVSIMTWVFVVGFESRLIELRGHAVPNQHPPLVPLLLDSWPAIVSGFVVGTGVALEINRWRKR